MPGVDIGTKRRENGRIYGAVRHRAQRRVRSKLNGDETAPLIRHVGKSLCQILAQSSALGSRSLASRLQTSRRARSPHHG
jgi:hypothetical protein